MIGSALAVFIFSMIAIVSMLIILHLIIALCSRTGEVSLIIALLTTILLPAFFWSHYMQIVESGVDFFVITAVGLLLTAIGVWIIDVIDRVIRKRSASE